MVDELTDAIYGQNLSRGGLQNGMGRFRNAWEQQRWPVFAELKKFLEHGRQAPPGASAPAKIETIGHADVYMRLKDEFLARVVALYGDPNAERPVVTMFDRDTTLPPAYAEENAFTIRMLGWMSDKLEDLARWAHQYPNEDYAPMIETLIPSPSDAAAAKAMGVVLKPDPPMTAATVTAEAEPQ